MFNCFNMIENIDLCKEIENTLKLFSKHKIISLFDVICTRCNCSWIKSTASVPIV